MVAILIIVAVVVIRLGIGMAMGPDEPVRVKWHRDPASYAITEGRLGQVGNHLDGLAVTGKHSHARLVGCRDDSGDLIQPRVTATWTAEGAGSKRDQVISAMEADGWDQVGGTTTTPTFKRSFGSWDALAYVWVGGERSVQVEVLVLDARPCKLD